MKLFDVNVLVYAIREELAFHAKSMRLLNEAIVSPEPFAVSEIVLAGFVRLVCHRKTFKTPTPLNKAIEFAAALRGLPNVVPAVPGPRHWDLFTELVTRYKVPGDEVWDAYLAAVSIDCDCTWVSFDQGFARFSELKWINALKD